MSRWYNETNRGGGSWSTGRSGNVQKMTEILRSEIMERLKSKKQNIKINLILYRKAVKNFTVVLWRWLWC